jgi:alpha-ketoglutarate-dependent taurine dioxygenase
MHLGNATGDIDRLAGETRQWMTSIQDTPSAYETTSSFKEYIKGSLYSIVASCQASKSKQTRPHHLVRTHPDAAQEYFWL